MDFDYFPLKDGEPGLRTVQISPLGRRNSWLLARVDSWKRQLKYIQLPSLLEKQPLVGAEHPKRELRGTIARFDYTQIRDFRDVCIVLVLGNDVQGQIGVLVFHLERAGRDMDRHGSLRGCHPES